MTNDPWYVVLTQSQQAIQAVWRVHELGLELFVPVIRRRVKTGRIGRDGRPVTRTIPKPMFPGYGFVRCAALTDIGQLCDVRGVRDIMRGEMREPVTLPAPAIDAIFAEQIRRQHDWIAQSRAPRRGRPLRHWKVGDVVRVEEGSVYSGMVAAIDKVDGRGRIEILFGMIRHSLPSDMVEVAQPHYACG